MCYPEEADFIMKEKRKTKTPVKKQRDPSSYQTERRELANKPKRRKGRARKK